MRAFWTVLCVIIFSWSGLSFVHAAEPGEVDQIVRAKMERQHIVGAAVGVIRAGKVTYTQGYGLADYERKVDATELTVFNWASNSKPVMAVAALQLVESGHLELDVGIGRYLSELPAPLQQVTTRQLLCHQSGVPHYGQVVPSGKRITLEQQWDPAVSIHRFLRTPLAYEPGSQMVYSSYAYVLLSAAVQQAGRERIAEQLWQRIGKPLGFKSFQLDLPYKDQQHWAVGYQAGPNGFPRRQPDRAHFWKHGAGGYKSNIGDFARWAVALMKSELIREETSRQMWQAQQTTDGATTRYGLGVVVSDSDGELRISHGGSQEETRTHMLLSPGTQRGVVFMCNTNNADAAAVAQAVFAVLD